MGHSFCLRFHRRARHIKLKLLRDGSLEVVAPPGTSRHVIQCFVEANGDWVDQARERLPKRRSDGPESGPFPELLQLRALDERAPVIWADDSASAYRWTQHGVQINLTQRDAGLAHELLVRALKARAVEHLEPRFHSLAGRFDKTVGRLTWRNQKTRWGQLLVQRQHLTQHSVAVFANRTRRLRIRARIDASGASGPLATVLERAGGPVAWLQPTSPYHTDCRPPAAGLDLGACRI